MSSQTFTSPASVLTQASTRLLYHFEQAEEARLAPLIDLRLMTCRSSASQSLGVGSGGVDSCLRGGHWLGSMCECAIHIVADAIGTWSLIYKGEGSVGLIDCVRSIEKHTQRYGDNIDLALEHRHMSTPSSPLRGHVAGVMEPTRLT